VIRNSVLRRSSSVDLGATAGAAMYGLDVMGG